nr:AAA family ATPase [Bacteroidota bacterium]
MNLTDHIEKIFKKTENSGMAATTMKGLMPHLRPLMDFLNCTENQAMIFALVFYITLENGEADLGDLARHLEIPVMRMLKYKSDIDYLVKRRLIRQQESNGVFSKQNNHAFYVHSKIIDGVLKRRMSINFGEVNNNYDFIIRVVEEMEGAKDDAGGYENLKADILDMCRENKNLHIAQRLLNADVPEHDRLILVYVAYKLMNGEDDIPISDACEFLENNKSFGIRVRRNLMNGTSVLIKRGFIETNPGVFRNNTGLNITDKGMEFLLGNEAAQFSMRMERVKNEITPEKIAKVKLFLNQQEEKQIQTIEALFEQQKYLEITGRMKQKNMKAGFTVLLYGGPGTGKTESVYQLARKTGRSVLPVEISQTKSMWFGESEKLIKGVFDRYRRLSEENNNPPILLFNEADGIFSTRTTKLDAPVSQTLNAMQNIILQEMEDFEGIMIATTNLTDNLDKAFDRRFLYKVKFEVPDLTTRKKIMHDKLPFLQSPAIDRLCGQFALTGGQMANIAKKCGIHELLQGALPNIREMENLCREELGLMEKKRLGF